MRTHITPFPRSSWGSHNGSWLLIAVLIHSFLFWIPIPQKAAMEVASETVQLILSDPPPPPPLERPLDPPSVPVHPIETPPPQPAPVVRKPEPRRIHPIEKPRPKPLVSQPVVPEAPSPEPVAANDVDAADRPLDPVPSGLSGKGEPVAASSSLYAPMGPPGPVESKVGAVGGPQFVHRVLPQYPRLARRLGVEGTVVLRLSIDASGKLTQAEVVQSAGHGFDEEALRAVRESVFSPAVREGRPVACSALLQIRFQLDN